MLGEFLSRLAIALPLVCAAAVLTLLALKRGWVRLPSFVRTYGRNAGGTAGYATAVPSPVPDLAITAIKALSPSSRVAVIRFHGRDHLVGITGNAFQLLATADKDAPAGAAETGVMPNPQTPLRQEPAPWTS